MDTKIKRIFVEVFYGKLGSHMKTVVDAAAGGAFLNKDYAEAYELLEEVTTNAFDWNSRRDNEKKVASIHEVDALAKLSAKLDQVLSFQTTILKGNFGEGIEEAVEEVNYVRNNNPYSNIYNPGWRNHPNFSWKNQGQGNPPFLQQQQQPPKMNLEGAMAKLAAYQADVTERTNQFMSNTTVSIKQLENQVGEISQLLTTRQPSSLPSTTKANPREHVHVIFLRNGKVDEIDIKETLTAEGEKEEDTTTVSKAPEPKKVE
ncbi:hypothetical protein L6164_005720 [Bauhinia variegata]|uniref:Uncharacterized protein n=1 Tax=Bauhinia variegata TaxID=167791 RepID=A0ACB9PUX3_BAUVA|nr:hypothetical protein L6164_005720 [Bauhinia variegata]